MYVCCFGGRQHLSQSVRVLTRTTLEAAIICLPSSSPCHEDQANHDVDDGNDDNLLTHPLAMTMISDDDDISQRGCDDDEDDGILYVMNRMQGRNRCDRSRRAASSSRWCTQGV